MSARVAIGRQLEAVLGKERTDQIRKAERRQRKALARKIAPASPVKAPKEAKKESENPLTNFFFGHDGRLIDKWIHYLDIYHTHFARYRGRPITVLEFGVFHGGSLQMWKDYFGPAARIVGVDINAQCLKLVEENIEIYIGDQEDRVFLRELAAKIGPVDILIEDGGHYMGQQIATFEEFWPHIADDGIFLIEDLHTSYWDFYGGGHRQPGTFIEFAKNLLDQLNAWHSKESGFVVDSYTTTIRGMHVYDSVIVFDKGSVRKPWKKKVGVPSF